jgi:hypothetical protein
LQRSKIVPSNSRAASTVSLVDTYIRECIQPFVDRKLFTDFDVWVTRVDKQRIDALLRIYRGPLPNIELRYEILWEELIEDAP